MLNTTLKITAVSVLAFASMANAANYNFDKTYITASVGSSNMGDESGTGFTVFVGTAYEYESSFLKDLDTRIEIGYLTTSKSSKTVGATEFETSATALFGMQRLNYNVAPNIDVVAKVGFTMGEVSVTTTNGITPVESETSKYALSYAIGGEYSLSEKLTAGATFTNYTADITSFDATISYKF